VNSLTNNVKYVQAEPLRQYCTALFESVGMPKDEAYINADNLVDADLTGVESHGVSRMAIYLKRIRDGVVNPKCEIKVVAEHPAVLVIDAKNSMGAVASYKAMEMAIKKAKASGVAFVTVRNSNHYGTAAYYTKMALEHDMIGFSSTNGPARMAPWGGKDPYFGTNPFSIAVPAGQELPVVADMATSLVARGKIILAAKNNKEIPLGWAINKDGEDTTNAKEALEGTVLPFGGPKGSAIALLIDVFSGILAGASFGPHIKDMYANFEEPTNTGHIFGAFDISKFIDTSLFKQNMDQMIREIKGSTPAKGVQEIFLPGEIELKKKQQRLKEGIPLSPAVIKELKEEGALCRVAWTLD
jgi:LDH2 family malate/lactate/ureidoglycolate dehydrogenase